MHKPFHWSLGRRIFSVFAICMVFSLLCTGGTLYLSIDRFVLARINSEYQNKAELFKLSLENLIDAINHVSQQLSYNNEIKDSFEHYLLAENHYDKIDAYADLKKLTDITLFSNPNVGFFYYVYEDTGEVIYSDMPMKQPYLNQPDDSDLFFKYEGASYYGMITSQSVLSSRKVITVRRDFELLGRPVRLFVETSFKELDKILESYAVNNAKYLILDNAGKVVFSQDPARYAKGSMVLPEQSSSPGIREAKLFSATANQGWQVILIMDRMSYEKEAHGLILMLFIAFILLLIFFMVSAALLWRRICLPLTRFDQVMDKMLSENYIDEKYSTGIKEYDHLMNRFNEMNDQLQEMIEQTRQQERYRAQLEIQKIRAEINPHFLMNTLNSVHWLAMMHHEDQIDDMVLSLNRLLLYNLKESNGLATLADEKDAVEQYIKLQSQRYNFSYECRIKPENADLSIPFPKFILQPMIENALSHGYKDQMKIILNIELEEDRITIRIEDNGIGMPQEKVKKLTEHLQNNSYDSSETIRRTGMGIGLRYVVQTINLFYAGKVQFRVHSEPNVLTAIELSVCNSDLHVPNS